MSIARRTIVTGLLLLFVLTGCTPTAVKRITPSEENRVKIFQEIQTDFSSIRSFHGNATLTLDTPEQSGRISAEIELKPFTRATILIKTPFGGQFGRLELRKNYAMFYDASGALKYIGPPENAGVPGLPDIVTGDQQLIRLLIGAINLPDAGKSSALKSEKFEDNLYHITYQNDENTTQYWIDPAVRKITQYQQIAEKQTEKTVINLSDYAEVDGLQLPRLITVTQPGARRLLSIYYHNIQITRKGNPYAG